MAFNAFGVKKAAHSLSRENTSWNPFRHTYRGYKDEKRRQTWNIPESQREEGRPDSQHVMGIHAFASQTAPNLMSTSGGLDSVGGSSNDSGSATDVNPATAVGTTGVVSGSEGVMRRRTSVEGAPVATDGQTGGNGDGDGDKPKKSRTYFKQLTPKTPFTVGNQIQRTLFNSWINVLLLAAPVGIAVNFIPSVSRVAVFIINFIAIVPLAAMLSFATEEIALRTGETLGGLLNATFGNAVELIVAVIALAHKEVVIVQTSLIGSILSNLLLVMGMCFFFGGINRREQFFNTTVAQTAASLLALAVASVIVPTVFDLASNTETEDVARLSRGTSIILLVVYGAYLLFQLKTHSAVFAEESQKVAAKPLKHSFRGSHLKEGAVAQGFVSPAVFMGGHAIPSKTDNENLRKLLTTPPKKAEAEEEEDGGEEPQLHFIVALATLLISTIIIAFCAEFMVDGISAVTEGGTVSKEFVGLILLPIVGNAAEHATAVTVAVKDKMDLAIGVAVGSSMQVALFIIPLLIIIGWGMGVENMTLSFDLFQVAVLFVAVLLVNYLIADGKSHWLEGLLLICLYCIIAVCSWWYPTTERGSSS